jgi:membrane-bound lytic murein transglycosylase D
VSSNEAGSGFGVREIGIEFDMKLSNKAIRAIKVWVDSYAERVKFDSSAVTSSQPFHEDLLTVFNRAIVYAPMLNRTFKAYKVPPLVGLYIPMIESEYHKCTMSPDGGKGMFSFMPETARKYGLKAEEMCDEKKAALAAARYISDRIAEIGSSAESMTLVILSFHRGWENIMRDLRLLRSNNPDMERSFWALLENERKLDAPFHNEDIFNEDIFYVPRFFAAAIVGENPESFGLQTLLLSSY